MAKMVYDPETGEMIDQYQLYFKQKRAKQLADQAGIEDMSGTTPESNFDYSESFKEGGTNEAVSKNSGSAGATGAMGGMQQAIASGGSKEDIAASGLTGAGMATANPYLVGAGLGLTALSAVNKAENERANQRYLAEVQRYNQRQAAIARMAELGRGLKA